MLAYGGSERHVQGYIVRGSSQQREEASGDEEEGRYLKGL